MFGDVLCWVIDGGGLKKPGGGKKTASVLDAFFVSSGVHLESIFGKLSLDYWRSNFDFFSGSKCKCAVVNVKHAKEFKECAFRDFFW